MSDEKICLKMLTNGEDTASGDFRITAFAVTTPKMYDAVRSVTVNGQLFLPVITEPVGVDSDVRHEYRAFVDINGVRLVDLALFELINLLMYQGKISPTREFDVPQLTLRTPHGEYKMPLIMDCDEWD